MYNKAITNDLAVLVSYCISSANRRNTKVRKHAPEDSKRRGWLLIQPPERHPWQALQVVKGRKS